MEEMETYVFCCQNTVSQYIDAQPILELCLVAKQHPGARLSMRWWDQDGLDLGQGDTGMETETEMDTDTDTDT